MWSLLVGMLGCGGSSSPPDPPEPAAAAPAPPPRRVRAPRVQFTPPTREVSTPVPVTDTAPELANALRQVRKPLVDLVNAYGRNPQSPWALAHAMLALGPDIEIPGHHGHPADFFAENYGQPVQVGQDLLWTFPPQRGGQLVDVHTDLLLKAFTEGGLTPDREVVVAGQPTTLGALYRNSLYRAWTENGITGFQGRGFNDAAWALQALTAWAPTHLQYRSEGEREMRLQDLTRGMREAIARDTANLKAAAAEGRLVQKDTRKGFFAYTCGGQHAIQGLTYAVARGFGNAADRHEVCEQIELLDWRTTLELSTVDPMIEQGTPDIKLLLYVQRLKYLGHTLETVHKAAAMGVCKLDERDVTASQRVARELVRTVRELEKMKVFDNIPAIARNPGFDRIRKGGGQQVVLDLIGDSAHAVRGIDLATGRGVIRY